MQDHGGSATAPPTPTADDRLLSSIQVLRALAAWSVVIHHYCMIFAVQNPSWWRRGFLSHGSLGVDVFFVISGCVMGLSASAPALTPRAFLAKRVGRIVPAYWLFTLIVALVITYRPDMMPQQGCSPEFLVQSLLFVPAQNPGGLGLLPVNTVGWTLNLEVVFYLIVGVSLFARPPQRWLWIVTGIAAVQLLLAPLGVVSPLYSSPILYEFAMGLAVAHLWKADALRGPIWLFAGLAIFAVALLLRSTPGSWTHVIDCGVPAFLLVCAVIGGERYLRRATLLQRLGDHSYSVYLAHPVILYVGYHFYKVTHIRHGVVSIACLLLIALVGAASYRFVERPASRWVSRRLAGRRSGAR